MCLSWFVWGFCVKNDSNSNSVIPQKKIQPLEVQYTQNTRDSYLNNCTTIPHGLTRFKSQHVDTLQKLDIY